MINVLFLTPPLIVAVFLLWLSTNLMLTKRKIVLILPFFVSGVLLCLNTGLGFYDFFDQKIWFIVEFGWAILFLWIFLNLKHYGDN